MRAALGQAVSPPLDLADALRRCAAGERSALRAVYDAEAPRMTGVAMRLLRRRALAEEAVHDTFMQVWQRAATYDPAVAARRGLGSTPSCVTGRSTSSGPKPASISWTTSNRSVS